MLGIKKWISTIRLSKEEIEEVTQADKVDRESTEVERGSNERSEGDLRRRKRSKVKRRSSRASRSSKEGTRPAKCLRGPLPSDPQLDGSPLPSALSSSEDRTEPTSVHKSAGSIPCAESSRRRSDGSFAPCSQQSSKVTSQNTPMTARSAPHTSSSSVSTAAPALITAWWECTPTNLHTVTLNFLYDTDNSRCDLVWTILENILKYPRENLFYTLLVALVIYIAFNEPARFTYYVIGFAYPMFKTFRVFKYRRSSEYSGVLRYWVVFGWFALVDVFLYSCMEKRPIYWSLKTLFATYLLIPFIRGSDLIYHDFARSFTKHIQIVIDQFSYYHEAPTASDFVDRRGID